MEGKPARETLLNRLYGLSPADLEPVEDTELTARHWVCCLWGAQWFPLTFSYLLLCSSLTSGPAAGSVPALSLQLPETKGSECCLGQCGFFTPDLRIAICGPWGWLSYTWSSKCVIMSLDNTELLKTSELHSKANLLPLAVLHFASWTFS